MINKLKNIPVNYIFLFIAGVIFRLILIRMVPQPLLIGDQYDYQRFAIGILNNGVFALSSRVYGYPLFLAVIYAFFGVGNTAMVIFVQAVLDVLTALMLFDIGRSFFKSKFAANLTLLIYLFNPFTANFVGLILTEILAIFFTVLIFWLLLKTLNSKKIFYLLLLALTFGFLPQIRPPFIFWTLAMMVVLLIFLKKRILIFLAALCLYCLPFLYNLAGNKIYFDEFSPLTVDNIFVRELYISMFIGRSPAHDTTLKLDVPMYMFPREVQQIYREITPLPKDKQERRVLAAKYFKLSLDEIKKDPYKFTTSHLAKMWYVWEKHFIFYYYEPVSLIKDGLIYWGNVLFLILGFSGLTVFLRQAVTARNKSGIWFAKGVFSLFIYISLIHAFSLSEERYSLPFYPFIFLFASYCIFRIKSWCT